MPSYIILVILVLLFFLWYYLPLPFLFGAAITDSRLVSAGLDLYIPDVVPPIGAQYVSKAPLI